MDDAPWRVTMRRVGADYVVHLHVGNATVMLPALEAHKLGSALHAASGIDTHAGDEAELDRLRQVVTNTATDARILLKAITMQSPDAVVGLAERIYQRHEPWDVGEEGDVSITCPRCGRTSHNPNDFAAGYCGACRDWTSTS
jgi:hypothetical protein